MKNTAKTFVIDHPVHKKTHFLIHACLEGPEAGVYYRGCATIMPQNTSVQVTLPPYTTCFCLENYSVYLTAKEHFVDACVTDVSQDGCFSIRVQQPASQPLSFFWCIIAQRQQVISKVLKHVSTPRCHVGPYTWLQYE